MGVDGSRNIRHTSIADLDCITVENFSKFAVFGEVNIKKMQKFFTYVGFHDFTERRIIVDYLPLPWPSFPSFSRRIVFENMVMATFPQGVQVVSFRLIEDWFR